MKRNQPPGFTLGANCPAPDMYFLGTACAVSRSDSGNRLRPSRCGTPRPPDRWGYTGSSRSPGNCAPVQPASGNPSELFPQDVP